MVLQPHMWHAVSILGLWQQLHRAGASKVDSGGFSVLGGETWHTKALHSQKQVFSGSGPVDLRGCQSPASAPAPPGAAGAPAPPEQGDPGLSEEYYDLRSLNHVNSEKAMATHSSTLAWKIPWALRLVQLFATPWTVVCQAPLFMEFSR